MKLAKEIIYDKKTIEGDYSRMKEMIRESEDNLMHLKTLSLKAEESDEILGSFFYLNVADGRAYYQVQEFNSTADKYFVKRCPGICLDEYADQYLGDSRWVDGEYVRHNVESRKALERLFSR